MPVISTFFGIDIEMYWRDHAPPHFHAYYQGFEALFEIETGDLLSGRFPLAARRLIADWASAHREELRGNWDQGRKMLPFRRIKGADAE